MRKFDLVKLELKSELWPKNSKDGFSRGLGLMVMALNCVCVKGRPDKRLRLRWERAVGIFR